MYHCHLIFFIHFTTLTSSMYVSLVLLSFNFILLSARTEKSTVLRVLFFIESHYLVILPRLVDLFVSQNCKELSASHSSGWILWSAYSIYSYGHIFFTNLRLSNSYAVISGPILFLRRLPLLSFSFVHFLIYTRIIK